MEWEQSPVLQEDVPMADSLDQPPKGQLVDPLQYLPLELIGDIIGWIDLEDTETLRRVSKGWKIASEYSNTAKALLQRFPHLCVNFIATPAELNLAFRRSLFYVASLRRGLATTVHRFSDVQQWMIRKGHMAIKGSDNLTSIYCLRHKPGSDVKAKSAFPRNAKASVAVPWAFAGLVGDQPLDMVLISLNCKGEAIVSVKGLPGLPAIAKITSKQTFVWCVKAIEGPTCVGASCIFTFGVGNSQQGQTCLVAQRLKDGSTKFERPVVGRLPHEILTAGRTSLIMICDDRFAVVKSYRRTLCIIEVSSGQTVPLIGTPPSDRILSTKMAARISSPNFELSVLERDKQFSLHRYTYDPEVRKYSVTIVQRLGASGEGSSIGVSAHNEVLFMPVWREDKITVGFDVKEFGSAPERISRKITVPSAKGRQELAIPKQSENEKLVNNGDYVGMTEGYFIYHDATNHMLTLAGFWPSW